MATSCNSIATWDRVIYTVFFSWSCQFVPMRLHCFQNIICFESLGEAKKQDVLTKFHIRSNITGVTLIGLEKF